MSGLKSFLGFQNLFSKEFGKDIFRKPTRLLTGIDPASTKVWNKVLGKDDKPLVNAFGSPGEQYYQQAEAKGIDTGAARGFHALADKVAGFYGAQGIGNAMAGGASAGGSGGEAAAGDGKFDIMQAMMKQGFGGQPQASGGASRPFAPISDGSPIVAGGDDERMRREQILQAQLELLRKGMA
jgi:hypothetical protein